MARAGLVVDGSLPGAGQGRFRANDLQIGGFRGYGALFFHTTIERWAGGGVDLSGAVNVGTGIASVQSSFDGAGYSGLGVRGVRELNGGAGVGMLFDDVTEGQTCDVDPSRPFLRVCFFLQSECMLAGCTGGCHNGRPRHCSSVRFVRSRF